MEESLKKATESYVNATPSEKQLLENIFGKEAFKSLDKHWLKLFEEFCKESGLNYEALMAKWEGEDDDDIAYKMIKRILKFHNKDWVADIKNKQQKKWYPWFYWDEQSGFGLSNSFCFSTYSDTDFGSRLYSQSQEQCISVAKKYLPIYQKFHTKY